MSKGKRMIQYMTFQSALDMRDYMNKRHITKQMVISIIHDNTAKLANWYLIWEE